jgi:hypothetical protein
MTARFRGILRSRGLRSAAALALVVAGVVCAGAVASGAAPPETPFHQELRGAFVVSKTVHGKVEHFRFRYGALLRRVVNSNGGYSLELLDADAYVAFGIQPGEQRADVPHLAIRHAVFKFNNGSAISMCTGPSSLPTGDLALGHGTSARCDLVNVKWVDASSASLRFQVVDLSAGKVVFTSRTVTVQTPPPGQAPPKETSTSGQTTAPLGSHLRKAPVVVPVEGIRGSLPACSATVQFGCLLPPETTRASSGSFFIPGHSRGKSVRFEYRWVEFLNLDPSDNFLLEGEAAVQFVVHYNYDAADAPRLATVDAQLRRDETVVSSNCPKITPLNVVPFVRRATNCPVNEARAEPGVYTVSEKIVDSMTHKVVFVPPPQRMQDTDELLISEPLGPVERQNFDKLQKEFEASTAPPATQTTNTATSPTTTTPPPTVGATVTTPTTSVTTGP